MGNVSGTSRARRWLTYGTAGSEDAVQAGPTTLAASANLQDVSYEVPMSIWTAAVLIPVLQERSEFRSVLMYFYCALTAALQLGILYVLWQITLDLIRSQGQGTACSDLSQIGLPVCLTIFEIVVMKDIYEAIEFAQYIQNLPSGSPPLMFEADADKRLKVVGGGLSTFHTAAAWLCVFLQIAIDVVIAFMGGAHLGMQPDNNELILNTVGLLFTIEIDTIIFLFFLPRYYQKLIFSMPSVEEKYVDLEGKLRGTKVSKVSVWMVLEQVIKVFLVFAVVGTLLEFLPTCGDIRDGKGFVSKKLRGGKGYESEAS